MPKQYLNLLGQPIAMHSLNTFGHMPEVGEVVVVCDPTYRCPATEHHSVLLFYLFDPPTKSGMDLQGSLPGTLGQVTQHCEA